MWNKYIILHNKHDEKSRAFVLKHGASYQVLDWYDGDLGKVSNYCGMGFPHPSSFPCFVDTEEKLIVNEPETDVAAKEIFNKHIDKKRQDKYRVLESNLDLLLEEVSIMIQELVLKIRKDEAEIKAFFEEIHGLKTSLKKEDGAVAAAIDAVNITTKINELKTKKPKKA